MHHDAVELLRDAGYAVELCPPAEFETRLAPLRERGHVPAALAELWAAQYVRAPRRVVLDSSWTRARLADLAVSFPPMDRAALAAALVPARRHARALP